MTGQNNPSIEFTNHPELSIKDIALLRERTVSLAAVSKKRQDGEPVRSESFLTMTYLDERYGVPLDTVVEAIALNTIVAVPGAPSHVVGLTRIRGQILALVNLHIYWRHRISGHSDCDRAVIITEGEFSFGLVCNKVEGLRSVVSSAIEAPPSDLPALTQQTIQGITDRNILLLSPTKLIEAPGFLVR